VRLTAVAHVVPVAQPHFRFLRLTRQAAALLLLALFIPARAPAAAFDRIEGAIVKLYVVKQRANPQMPWLSYPPSQVTGSGFVIAGRKLLTNAHVVSDAKFIEVQRDADPRRYPARVEFIGHDCDLAMLVVDSPDFFHDTTTLKIASSLPPLAAEVAAIGFPAGGDRLSVTRGIVSRIDYGGYAHSGADQHLVLQVDAAINPGNSGGPILYGGKVAALAFQGMMAAENIGYGIPVPVLKHFLADVADGKYDGYPELGAETVNTRNPAIRKSLGIPVDITGGCVVSRLDAFGAAAGSLKPGDVLLTIDGYAIGDDGSILIGNRPVVFQELVERRQWGDKVAFSLLRGGSRRSIEVTLRNPFDPFTFRYEYDTPPRYCVYAGLVFAPLTREYMRTVSRNASRANDLQLSYYMQFAKEDGLYRDRSEFIVLIRRLPHSMNTHLDPFVNGIVDNINGRIPTGVDDLACQLRAAAHGFHRLEFAGMEAPMILDAAAAADTDPSIRGQYGIPPAEMEGRR